jgi:hypothetical protein
MVCFDLLFMKIYNPHDPGHEFGGLIQLTQGFFFISSFNILLIGN